MFLFDKHALRQSHSIFSLANIYPYIFTLSVLGIGKLELYIVIGISLSAGFLIFLLIHFVVAPWLKKRILAEEQLQPNYAVTEEELYDVSDIPEVQVNDEMPGLYYLLPDIPKEYSRLAL